jgi:glycosyltransferase involved in cell wall biosynthesis
VRILLWHGWLLEGSGSNVYTSRLATALRRLGHDVVVLCQETQPDHLAFVDAIGPVDGEGVGGLQALAPAERAPSGGRCVVLRPRIGSLLPVFVLDEYEGFTAKRFVDLTGEELEAYLEANVTALRAAAEWHASESVVAGHAIPGPAIARRALGPGRYVAKIHGSDLEYAVNLQERYRLLAREGLEGAVAVLGGTDDVLRRMLDVVPGISGRTRTNPPGVEVDLFRLRDKDVALDELATLLASSATGRGRPNELDILVGQALDAREGDAIDGLPSTYDQNVPDLAAADRARALRGGSGPIVGYFGKLIPSKGVDLLMGALALRTERGLIVGFGSFREWLCALMMALDSGDREAVGWLRANSRLLCELAEGDIRGAAGLRSRISFTGRLSHRFAPQALAAVDVLVVPSILTEAFGMVAAEGAAAGALPLLAGHSGLAEVARALEAEVGRPGLFSFEPGDGATRRIALGLDRLLAIPASERETLRRGVSGFVGREWTWERAAGRLLEASSA